MPSQLDSLDHWRTLPDQAAARLARRRRRRRGLRRDRHAAAARLRRRGRQPARAARPCRLRSRLPAAGRRLRRDVRRRDRRADPQPRQDGAADGGRADVRRVDADREDGAHGGPVRQAALERHRDPRRRDPARLPRRHRQRLRLHRGLAHGRPAAAAEGLPHGRVDDQSRPRVHAGWLRRPARGALAGTRASPRTPRTSSTSASRSEIDRAIKFMEAAGADFDELRRVEFYTGHEGLLMDYERPDDAHRLAHRHAVQHLGALRLDRRAHARPRRRPHRLLLEDPQPHRGQARTLDDARRPRSS